MDIQFFSADHARDITKESDGAFQELVNECWKEVKEICEKGRYNLEFEYKLQHKYLINRLVHLLRENGYSAKTIPHDRVVIDWSPSMEDQLNLAESEVSNG